MNGGSTVAHLPPLFLWRDPSGASLPMMYHWDYSGIAVVPGSDLAVVTSVRGDNSGPHTADEIEQIHADLAKRFPSAEITACNLSDMANAIAPYRDKLPVVTEEIGDTWIHGCGSDPLKVARYRAVYRGYLLPGLRRRRFCGRGRNRPSATAPCAAGGRAYLGHGYENLARFRQLRACGFGADAGYEEI